MAKGEGFLAERIRAVATEHHVPVVENKPLARRFIKTVDRGRLYPAPISTRR